MKSYLVLLYDFLLAVLATYVLASLSHSQFVLHELLKLGVEIDFPTRLRSSFEDLVGLIPAYGSAIALALLLGFICCALLNKFVSTSLRWLYPFAGASAMLVALMVMQPILDITLIAGARTGWGMAAQAAAGFFGGGVFLHQRRKHKTPC